MNVSTRYQPRPGSPARAEEVGGNAAGLAAAVAELKRSVVRAVRTSTGEVDRRLAVRYETDLACRFDTGVGGGVTGRLIDISETGARAAIAGVPDGARGVLTLHGTNMHLGASVLRAEDDSTRMTFDLDEAGTAALRQFIGELAASRAA